MSVDSLLLMGLLIGVRHALDADHVAAVASLSARSQSQAQTIRQGLFWGLGHTITLLLFSSVALFMDHVISDQLAMGLELAVGGMLVLLGGELLWRLLRERIHFHSHQHGDGSHHFHGHSHAGEVDREHDRASHHHSHPRRLPLRALMVGLMHGMAGSAAVILLALQSVSSLLQGVLYILVFGLGTMLGMALLSVVISIPLQLSANRLSGWYQGVQLLTSLATVAVGVVVIVQNHALWLA